MMLLVAWIQHGYPVGLTGLTTWSTDIAATEDHPLDRNREGHVTAANGVLMLRSKMMMFSRMTLQTLSAISEMN